jgi:exodeoxyribonuclease VIII
MRFGTAFHAIAEEAATGNSSFSSRYARMPEGIDRRTKAGQAAWADFEMSNEGKQTLKADEWDRLHFMRDALMANPVMKILLMSPGEFEQSFFAHDPVTGELLKARPDWNSHGDGIIVDFKSSIDASREEFSRTAYNYGYHVQPGFYIDVANVLRSSAYDTFLFCVVESERPFAVQCFEPTEELVRRGREQYRHDLDLYHRCRKANHWPGYPVEIQTLELPRWAAK